MTIRSKHIANIYIGTSGWHYDHWIGPFYPQDSSKENLLHLYDKIFATVEVNNTFYQLPSHETLTGWYGQTADDFRFSCKASRYITHMKKLKDPNQSICTFLERIEVLGDKLGPILFQLPPHWRVNAERLETFLATLPSRHRYAFEFRDESWCTREIYDILRSHGCGFCIHDLGGYRSPTAVTADLVYVRLHGPDGPYKGNYDGRTLCGWARRLIGWRDEGREVYCYFDNDEKGFAPTNAVRLLAMVAKG